jgi:hypothetical protein
MCRIFKLTVILLFVILLPYSVFSQRYFNEDFEHGIPASWEQEIIEGSLSWRTENGGFEDPNIHVRFPNKAKNGNLNALFQVQSHRGWKTKLITPPIDLSAAIKPELTFWHAQDDWGSADYEKVRVFIKKNLNDDWGDPFLEYLFSIPNWTLRSFFIPDSMFSDSVYIAFEGETNWGYGACIDSVEVTERGAIPMYMKQYIAGQDSSYIVPSGSENNPIANIRLNVFGNTGDLKLNSVSITPQNTDNTDIDNLGVKLFVTDEPYFNSDNQIGTSKTISDDTVTFGNLDYSLPFGYSYLWITYDISSGATELNTIDALFKTGSIDLKLDTTGMPFGENLYIEGNNIIYIVDGDTNSAPIEYSIPDIEISPEGNRTIFNSIFYDDFEGALNWTLNGDFQVDAPQGLGGLTGRNPDPDEAYDGTNVLGTDLTGILPNLGDYENFQNYYAQSGFIDCSYYKDVHAVFYSWINKEVYDSLKLKISVDSAKTWVTAKNYNAEMADNVWNYSLVDLSPFGAERKKNVCIRFNMGPTDGSNTASGLNVDNFAIVGDYLTDDIGVTTILQPKQGCGHTSTDSIKIIIRNYAALPTSDTVPVKYTFNGGLSYDYDTIYQSIPVSDSLVITLDKTVDLSVPGIYNVIIATDNSEDEDSTNDGRSMELYVQHTITPEDTENFETQQGLWRSYGQNSTWQWGIPAAGVYPPPSGNRAWVTNINKNYKNNDSSFVESVCYDLSDDTRYMAEISYWLDTEPVDDGFTIQYSIDEGSTWMLLDTNEYGWPLNWFTDSVLALESRGWAGLSGGWKTIKQILPLSTVNEPLVKFRIAFASDTLNVDQGVAFDDFKVYKAPPDVGVVSIDSVGDDCQYANPDQFFVTIKNFGPNDLEASDTILVGLDIDQDSQSFTEQLVLASDLPAGNTIAYQFSQEVDIVTPGIYNATAYTLSDDDPWFYEYNNDTATLTFEVMQNPTANWVDTITTKEPDTVVVRPNVPPVAGYEYLWEDMSDADSLEIPKADIYYVTITDAGGNGCVTVDSILIELLFNDIGIDSLAHPKSDCEIGDNQYPIVRLKNFGTDSIDEGEEVVVTYEFDDGTPVVDTIYLESALPRGRTLEHEFDEVPLDLSAIGSYKFKLYCDMPGDTVLTNDTLVTYTEVFGYPTVDIGPDTTVHALTYELDPGSSYSAYLWEDGDTNQVHVAESTGIYHVIVWDENGCEAYDTAKIRIRIRDVSANALINPESNCTFPAGADVMLEVENTGNDTLLSGEQIYVRYKLDSNPFETATITLLSQLIPASTYIHTFDETVNLSSSDDYRFTLVATIDNDLRSENDTLIDTVYVYPAPVVDFGLENPYIVEAAEVLLDAGYGEYYAYNWQDAHDEQTYLVTASDLYSVTVTDTRTECYSSDNITVYLNYHDVGITDISLTEEMCSGVLNDVEVEISNLGTYFIDVDDDIYVKYYLDGDLIGNELVERQTDLGFGQNIDFQLGSTVNLSETGIRVFTIFTVLDIDIKPSNDTVTVNMVVEQSPVVDFGDDNGKLNVDLPHVLHAGGGHASYIWQDATIDSTYNVTSAGIYTVTVTAYNGCQTIKSVRINMPSGINNAIEDVIQVKIYPNPANDILNLEIDVNGYNELKYELLNSQGMLISNSIIKTDRLYNETIDISGYSKGIYYLRIYNRNLIHVSKVIIY